MTMLEDALRQTFADSVDTVPPPTDPAGRAIARAQVLRRRHRTVAGTAVIVALVVLAGGAWLIRDVRGISGTASNTAADGATPADALDADLFAGGEVYVGGAGAPSQLPAAEPDGTQVIRVPAGFLYRSDDWSLDLLASEGKPNRLADHVATFAAAADGRTITWIEDAGDAAQPLLTVHFGTLDDGQVAGARSAPVPAGTSVIGITGGHVVLAGSGARPRFDVWNPTGPYKATWSDQIHSVAGIYPGGVVGVVKDNGGDCLALFVPRNDGLHRQTSRCDLTGGGGPIQMEFDGTRLAAIVQRDTVTMVDPRDVFTGGAVLATRDLGAQAQDAVWAGGDRLVVQTESGFSSCVLDRCVALPVTLPTPRDGTWQLVRRAGAR